jgi:hypothetical protein
MEGLRIRIPHISYPLLPGDQTHKPTTARRVRFKNTPKFYSPIYENYSQKLDEHFVRAEILKNRVS